MSVMIQKMTQSSRLRYKRKARIITMPILRRRCKKMMRKKHKKTIKLKDLDRVWSSYAEWAIKHLIKYGKVNLGNHTTMEIVGKEIISDNRLFSALTRGKYVNKDGSLKTSNLSLNRPGVIYTIRYKNPDYKGQIIFDASLELRRRVSDHLKTSKQYYRIEK